MSSRGTTGGERSVDEMDLDAIATIVDDLLDSASAAAADAIWEQVPAYRDHPDPKFRHDVAMHCRHVFHAFAVSLRAQRTPQPEDFPLTSGNAMRRVEQDISLADFLQAFRVGQLSLWEPVLSAIGDDQHLRHVLLGAVAPLLQVVEVGSYWAASAYLEAEQYRLADHDRVRRDLVEDLLGDRAPVTAPRRAVLRSAGLGYDAAFVVVSAIPTRSPDDEHELRPAATLIRRAVGREARGLRALRQSEIVGVFPVNHNTKSLTAGLERARTELSTSPLPFTFGVSTTHSGIREIASAYARPASPETADEAQPASSCCPRYRPSTT